MPNLVVFKFKSILLYKIGAKYDREVPMIRFGIGSANNRERNALLYISAQVEKNSTTGKIQVENGGKTEVIFRRNMPECAQPNPEFSVAVNTDARTVRFFINGSPVNDGDVPIPLTQLELRELFFVVWLFWPGDCVSVVD